MAARQPRWLGLSLAALGLLALAMMSCGESGSVEPEATPTITPTATGAGFLPTWTPSSTATDVPGTRLGPLGKCPPMPKAACLQPAETTNLYEVLELDRVEAIEFSQGAYRRWVLDKQDVQRALLSFDQAVTVQQFSMLNPGILAPERFRLSLLWPRGEGLAWPGGTLDSVSLIGDTSLGVIGESTVGTQMPLPDGFMDLLFASFSDVTPTPEPYHSPVPTPTIVGAGTVRFGHPTGPLVWDGPDARVRSYRNEYGDYICGNFEVSAQFGVPTSILVDGGPGFYLAGAVRPPERVHRTGYFYDEWQIWQGNDPGFSYVFRSGDPIAFEYRTYDCIIF